MCVIIKVKKLRFDFFFFLLFVYSFIFLFFFFSLSHFDVNPTIIYEVTGTCTYARERVGRRAREVRIRPCSAPLTKSHENFTQDPSAISVHIYIAILY